ncbi:MAG: DUF1385 domain-containing protein [Dissulfurimicrobium sp.]|uniref:DUF1385 domain-containing protein n=1 Tax=Dissulfurimicrobium sp. TaxID=2022436 RepID=UPI00404ACF4C
MKNSSVNMASLKRNNRRKALKSLAMAALSAPVAVGGQAVIEGVMMRSPKAMAIAVRRANGCISVKEERWRSLSERLTFLKWPFIRGTVVLVEALINGIQAFNFSAHEALAGINEGDAEGDIDLSSWTLALTIFSSAVIGLCLFLAIPHLASSFLLKTWGIGGGVKSFTFHALDGLIKMVIFIGYVLLISRMADIKRIFEYHGAEHKAIYNYEAGKELCPANAKCYSTLHPRCGTAFIMVVFLVSVGVFAAVIPMIPFNGPKWAVTGQIILAKIFLMLPIAGAAYEITRLASKDAARGLIAPLIYPGLLMQTITTSNPTEDQLEVAIEALKRALKIEKESAC